MMLCNNIMIKISNVCKSAILTAVVTKLNKQNSLKPDNLNATFFLSSLNLIAISDKQTQVHIKSKLVVFLPPHFIEGPTISS